MYSKEDLLNMTNKAKARLEQQSNNDANDLYSEFREEFDSIRTENVMQSHESNFPNVKKESAIPTNVDENVIYQEDSHVTLKYEMNDDEYFEEETNMSEAEIQGREEFLYAGGPTVSEVDGWKRKYEGASIYASKILEEMFVFRTINRFEYKQLIRQSNLDASQREEIICETTVLHPYNYNWRSMAKREAGIPSTLSQIIMQKSGFTEEYYIEKL